MRKITGITAIFLLIFATNLYAGLKKSNVDVKAGISVPTDLNIGNIAVDGMVAVNLGFDKYFALGIETGVNWVNMSKYTAAQNNTAYSEGTYIADNGFTIPILISPRIRIPLDDFQMFTLYIVPSIGWAWAIHQGYNTYNGFVAQGIVGMAFGFSEDSFVKLTAELGYRYALLKDGTAAVDMSGFVAHVGVRFDFAGDDL